MEYHKVHRAYVAYSEDVAEILIKHWSPITLNDPHTINCNVLYQLPELSRTVSAQSINGAAKQFQLNTKKTWVLWFDPYRNLNKLTPYLQKWHTGSDIIMPTEVVCDLGVRGENEVTHRKEVIHY